MSNNADVEILLVEDNPDDAELTLRVLRNRKLANHVVWVRNGADALDFLYCRGAYAGRSAGGSPRLVLLDLNLPKVSGIEVLARIKSDPATRRLPVVVLSSSTHDKDVLDSYNLGVNSYVSRSRRGRRRRGRTARQHRDPRARHSARAQPLDGPAAGRAR
jgi:two-component system response regulator